MNSARHDLILMVKLQDLYDRVAETIKEWKTPPPEVQELKEANRLRQVELEELEASIEAFEEECREVRKKEEESKLELEHFQGQKALVTNEREFTAVISEIDYANKALEESTERRKELEDGIAEVSGDIESRRKARPEEEEAHREVVQAWEKRRTKLKKRVHNLAVEAKKIEGLLQPKARARFLRLLESKRGTAIAEVVEGSCCCATSPFAPTSSRGCGGRRRSSLASIATASSISWMWFRPVMKMAEIARRLAEVRRRVCQAAEQAGRNPASVTLVAVSKTHPAERLCEAVAAGALHLGENRIQEAVAKKPQVAGAQWHLIGPLQRNKARRALETFDLIHTVDRVSLVGRLQALLEQHWPQRLQRVLVEVNLGSEEQKAGVLPKHAGDLLRAAVASANLEVEGLMAIPPWGSDPEISRPFFARLRRLRDELQQSLGQPLPQLSMGMSHDYEIAIAEGATIVRVGTAIFGPRG